MATSADHLALEVFVEVALVVDLHEAIDDGHAVDLLVVLALDVLAREELEDQAAALDPVAVRARVLFSSMCSSLTYVPFVEPVSSTATVPCTPST